MRPTDVARSYDRIATRWTEPAFDSSNGIEPHRRALAFLARSGGAALDVGCGSSGRIIALLRSQGLKVEGLDISSEMLRLARAAQPQVTFHQADIRNWVLPRRYDFISAWDSIWHVPLSDQRAVLLKLCAGLTDGGVILFSAGGLDAADEHQNEHMGVPMYHATLGVPRILDVLAEGGCLLRHFEFDQRSEAHVYLIAQRCTLNRTDSQSDVIQRPASD